MLTKPCVYLKSYGIRSLCQLKVQIQRGHLSVQMVTYYPLVVQGNDIPTAPFIVFVVESFHPQFIISGYEHI